MAPIIKVAILYERLGINAEGSLHFAVDNTADTSNADLSDAKMTILRTGNVGIGTSAAAGSKLQVNGSAIFWPSTTVLSVSSGTSLAVSGNVGIGTTSPTALLHVQGTSSSMPSLLVTSGGNVGIGTSVSSNPLTVGTDGTNGNGAYLSAGGSWQNGSSFEFKENFTSLNSLDILSKINSLNLTQWNYKLEPDVKHIGPVAEEFYSIFGLGNDNKHISTIDPSGVALVGIQGLSLDISNIKDQISKLQLDMSKLNYGIASESALLLTSQESKPTWEVLSQATASPSATPGVDLKDQVASLSARIKDLELKGKSFLSSLIEFLGNVIFHGDVSFLGRPTFNKDTAGSAIIKKDADSVEVKFDKEYNSKPLVNVTITLDDLGSGEASQSALERQILDGDIRYIVSKRSTKGFTIKINKPAFWDLMFSWSALAVKDGKVVRSSELVVGRKEASVSASPEPVASASASLNNEPSTINPKPITIKVNKNELGFLRVREDASTVSPEVGQVSPGQMFAVLVEKSGWYEIEYKPDFYGWVSGSYVQVQ